MIIDEKLLDHLFDLSRIKREEDPDRRKKLIMDLSNILDYFKQLKEVDTDNVEPMTGGTFLSDVFREDDVRYANDNEMEKVRQNCVNQFPKSENKYLKTPPVFE